MNKSESIAELAKALCKAQGEMSGAAKASNNPFFNSKYADLKEVIKAIKEPFANHGLSYVQFPIEEGGRIGIETILMHESGEYLSNSFTVNLSKQDAQGAGSAITYCRRYGLQAVAGIPSEDDDGNVASSSKPIAHPNSKEAKEAKDKSRRESSLYQTISGYLADEEKHPFAVEALEEMETEEEKKEFWNLLTMQEKEIVRKLKTL